MAFISYAFLFHPSTTSPQKPQPSMSFSGFGSVPSPSLGCYINFSHLAPFWASCFVCLPMPVNVFVHLFSDWQCVCWFIYLFANLSFETVEMEPRALHVRQVLFGSATPQPLLRSSTNSNHWNFKERKWNDRKSLLHLWDKIKLETNIICYIIQFYL